MKVSLGDALDGLTKRIVGAAFAVHNGLGHGFVEAVYKKALLRELADCGLEAAAEVPFQVRYKGDPVGSYFADIVVEGSGHHRVESMRSIG